MKKCLMGLLAAGLMATAANAAELSLRFAGGGTEATLDASGSVTIEVLIKMTGFDVSTDTAVASSFLTGIDARFDVGPLALGTPDPVAGPANWRQEYISPGDTSTKLSVTSVSGYPGWDTAQSIGVGGAFNRNFFLAAGDTAGALGVDADDNQLLTVIASITLHKESLGVEDTYIAFRQEAPLPALYDGSVAWTNRWRVSTQAAPDQFLQHTSGNFGAPLAGNPGDADPRWGAPTVNRNEVLSPLIIHQIPEPSTLALFALGGLAVLRRRN